MPVRPKKVPPQLIWPFRETLQRTIERSTQLVRKGPVALTDQFGFSSQINREHAPLPEVLLLGGTNVGKSSILRAILEPRGSSSHSKNKPRDLPWISKKHGYTKTISFFTIGNSLRLVDSPGYGFRSSAVQGSLISDYLELHSDNLKQAYLLVHAGKGLSEADLQVMDIVRSAGQPFDVVLTKCDLLKYKDAIDEAAASIAAELAGLAREAGSPQSDVFVTATESSVWPDLGIPQLRAAMLSVSGVFESQDMLRQRR